MAVAPLSAAALGPILAPFGDAAAGLEVIVEDAAGHVIATTGPAGAGVASPRATGARPIRSGDAILGRMVVHGATAAVVEAIAASLAAALEAIIGATLVAGSADDTEPERASAPDGGERLEAELALGRRIQRSFVSLVVPEIPGYEVASHYEAAREVGGDFFEVFRLHGRPGRMAIVVADVTGKGIAAALLMAFARPLLHAAIDHAGTAREALRRTNRILVEERRSSLFITAICAIVELRTGVLRIANAGHEPPLLVPGDGQPIRWLDGAGPLLGAFATLSLDEGVERLHQGDMVLLYTDGVTDARADSGDRFGDERLLEVVERCRSGTARELVDAVAGAAASFQGEMPAADDITIVAIRRSETAPRPPRRSRR